ncbi:hypothetical protein MKX03_020377 [Papaver bracteatum]|nr:hypothetical protein MKX03_020377 [Papaver bracteatum]
MEDHKSTTADELSERNWSDANFCKKFKLWHGLSKTLSEKTACINAGLLVGPEISMKASYLKGAAEMYEDGVLVTVDQFFLVDSHICVFEDVSSYRRYLCFNHVVKRPDVAVEFAKMLTPSTATTTLSAATRLCGIIKDLMFLHLRISCITVLDISLHTRLLTSESSIKVGGIMILHLNQ